VFALAGLPLEGWFWAVAIWATNRVVQVMVERRPSDGGAPRRRRAGREHAAAPLDRDAAAVPDHPHDSTMAISSVVLFMVLVTIDIATRILTHRNIRTHAGRTA
jgi:hypothetical protein